MLVKCAGFCTFQDKYIKTLIMSAPMIFDSKILNLCNNIRPLIMSAPNSDCDYAFMIVQIKNQ